MLDFEAVVETSSDSGTSYRTALSTIGTANGEDPSLSPAQLKASSSAGEFDCLELSCSRAGMPSPLWRSTRCVGPKHTALLAWLVKVCRQPECRGCQARKETKWCAAGALSRLASCSSPGEERGPHQREDQEQASHSGRTEDVLGDLPLSERAARSLLKSQSLRPHISWQQKSGSTEPAGALQVPMSCAVCRKMWVDRASVCLFQRWREEKGAEQACAAGDAGILQSCGAAAWGGV